jgi:glutaminyl-peptide cyclotransferase
MSKKANKRTPFASGADSTKPEKSTVTSRQQRPMRWDLVALFLLISVGGSYLVLAFRPTPSKPQFTYEEVDSYPHDKTAFTQGLLYHDGYLWESTGKKGKSTFRKVELKTGHVVKSVSLPDEYFGEGLAYHNGKFYQLTWQNGICLVYNEEMEKIKEFRYEGEGWGLTSDGTHLIMSDGTSALRFIDPQTFEEKHRVLVRLRGFRTPSLNELEYVGGKVFANVWMQNVIYEIDPKTGEVTKQIDLEGLWPNRERPNEGVLNGIAFNPQTRRLLVTGKYAPKVWEIEVVPMKNN